MIQDGHNERRGLSFEVVPLREEHLEEAAALFTTGYRAAREHEPCLPPCHEDAAAILPKLRDLTQRVPGVAAIRNGRVTGFLLGRVLPVFRGKRSVYSPEWAHAAEAEGRRDIYRSLYARISADWVGDGCFTHLITVLAHDAEAVEAFFWLEFGLTAVDAMRSLTPVRDAAHAIEIRRAGADDTQAVLDLNHALQQYMARAPMFLLAEGRTRESVDEWLADPARPVWLACRHGEAIACMGLGPASSSAAYVIRDEKTASISGAFAKEDFRGCGIGTALLNHALDWARSAGYERCAVDFEPQNIPGARFWLRHFQPVCYSLIRRVDESVAGASGG